MKRVLAICLSSVLVTVAPSARACRQLFRFPEHIQIPDQETRGRFYVVEIVSGQGETYVGKIKQSFAGKFEVGMPVSIRYSVGEEPLAVCPISIVPGNTYLLRAVRADGDLEISRYNWLSVPSTHERFPVYVHDVASGG